MSTPVSNPVTVPPCALSLQEIRRIADRWNDEVLPVFNRYEEILYWLNRVPTSTPLTVHSEIGPSPVLLESVLGDILSARITWSRDTRRAPWITPVGTLQNALADPSTISGTVDHFRELSFFRDYPYGHAVWPGGADSAGRLAGLTNWGTADGDDYYTYTGVDLVAFFDYGVDLADGPPQTIPAHTESDWNGISGVYHRGDPSVTRTDAPPYTRLSSGTLARLNETSPYVYELVAGNWQLVGSGKPASLIAVPVGSKVVGDFTIDEILGVFGLLQRCYNTGVASVAVVEDDSVGGGEAIPTAGNDDTYATQQLAEDAAEAEANDSGPGNVALAALRTFSNGNWQAEMTLVTAGVTITDQGLVDPALGSGCAVFARAPEQIGTQISGLPANRHTRMGIPPPFWGVGTNWQYVDTAGLTFPAEYKLIEDKFIGWPTIDSERGTQETLWSIGMTRRWPSYIECIVFSPPTVPDLLTPPDDTIGGGTS